MNTVLHASSCFACALACVLCGVVRAESAFRLADVAAVVLPRDVAAADRSLMSAAAADLTNAIFRTSGRLPIVCAEDDEPPGLALVYLGNTKAAAAAGLAADGLRNGDWRVKTVPGRAYLLAKSPWGATLAATDFAEREADYHVVFLEGDDVFSFDAERRVRVVDRTVRPAVYERSLYHGRYGATFPPEIRRSWDRFLRMHGFVGARIEGKWQLSGRCPPTHTSFKYLPPEKHFKDHPEWYALGPDGKRRGAWNDRSQICFSNPEAYREVLESLRRYVREDRAANPDDPTCVYDFSVMTYCNWMCCCADCRREIAKYNRVPGGYREGGDAGLMIAYANRLARDIRAEYPDVKIQTLFEVSHLKTPPKPGTISVEPNVWIYWRKDYGQTDHTQPFARADHFNRVQADEFAAWRALAPEIRIWDAIYNGFGMPEPLVEAFAGNARYFGRHRLEGSMAEMQYHGQPFYDLNCYLMAQLYAEPERDVEALVETYCRGYGTAADVIRSSLAYLREAMRMRPTATANDWQRRDMPWAEEAVLAKFYAPLNAAYAEMSDGWPRRRIARLVASTAKARLAVLRSDPDAAATYAAVMEDYRRIGATLPERTSIAQELERLTLRFKDLPEGLAEGAKVICVDAQAASYVRDDTASERGKASVYVSENIALPISCGVYDRKTGTAASEWKIAAEQVPADGAYRWVRLGETTLGADSIFWFPADWKCSFKLKDHYLRPKAGQPDPNRRTLYVSVRRTAEAVYIDRLVLAPL